MRYTSVQQINQSKSINQSIQQSLLSGRIAQVVEQWPLDREVRGALYKCSTNQSIKINQSINPAITSLWPDSSSGRAVASRS
jgi:hypothetical protein